MRLLLILLAACLTISCKQKTEATNLGEYFKYGDSIESAGVKMIPIKTPVGDFKVWTKRFGNNPKIKVLLLHGGPAMTHEYMECFGPLHVL
jgi:proline iminopeptidase